MENGVLRSDEEGKGSEISSTVHGLYERDLEDSHVTSLGSGRINGDAFKQSSK